MIGAPSFLMRVYPCGCVIRRGRGDSGLPASYFPKCAMWRSRFLSEGFSDWAEDHYHSQTHRIENRVVDGRPSEGVKFEH